MAEKAFLAYFKRPDQAEAALTNMKDIAVIASAIDRIDGYAGGGGNNTFNPYAGDFQGLGSLTLSGDFDNPDAGVLAAASVSASGMSSGGPENRVTGRDVLLTVIVDDEDAERVAQILEDCGALR
ncbi:hypothetical protein [Paenibacillus methanolicus]|uniref:hypothetical protein n=1 Tax=Paenibacillus methanolicus TaxID=582686 RepID=UPI0011E6E4A0|nr:hypothetical protein [Paenibacillus methanolicus]